MKLVRSRLAGGSAKQLADIRSVYELHREILDRAYVDRWARELDVADVWGRLVRADQAG